MKLMAFVLFTFLVLSCNPKNQLNGENIFNNAIIEHDSLGNWSKTSLNLHIQEPRISNPYRYSILKLNNSNNTFELSRNRDQHISIHTINADGEASTLLDGNKNIDSTLIKKYRLDPSRNIGYQSFYRLLYGLPMSLENSIKKIHQTTEEIFNDHGCYKIRIELKEKVISEHWNIFISKSNHQIKGVEIFFPKKPNDGERLYFEGIIEVNKMKIPRTRHWHELKNDAYSGSDIIIKENNR